MPVPRPALLVAIVAAVTVVGLVAVVGARVLTAPDDRVPPGVSIAGIPVGGLTAAQAERAVVAQAEPSERAVQMRLPGHASFPRRVPVAELAPAPRARLAVEDAMRRPSVGDRILSEIGVERTRDVPLRYRLEARRVAAAVQRVAGEVDRPARDAAVGVSGGRLVVRASAPGRRVDRQELRRRLSRLPDRLEVPVVAVPPQVTDAAARAARARAVRLTDRPVTVRGAGREAVVPPERLLAALRFSAAGEGIQVRLDPAALAAAVEPAFDGILRSPASASFSVQGDRVRVVPGRQGRRLDRDRLARRIERRPNAAAVAVPIAAVAPERTTAEAHRMRIREVVGEFTTPYACCQPRVTNIQRAAQILDGQIIPAGSTFSLNDAMGERTRARGFVPAPQINAGEYEDAVGGGVSQMATTVFNAAFFSGLRIVTHMPHEYWITRYPAGREATVSWGGPEMIVENDWPAAILLKVSATDTSLTVRMYSARLGRRVATETIGDPVAGAAFDIAYTRKVWRGGELRRDERFTWSYKAPPAG